MERQGFLSDGSRDGSVFGSPPEQCGIYKSGTKLDKISIANTRREL